MRIALAPALFLALAGSSVAQESLVEMTDAERAQIAAAITAQGMNCPEAKLAFAQGASARGNELQIYCGPVGGDEVFGGFSYRMLFRTDGSVVFEERD